MKGLNYTLITGSSGFLGKTISKTLLNSNKNLFISDLNEKKLTNLKYSLSKKFKKKIISFPCDLEDINSRNNLIKYIKEKKININCLINNAAFVGTSNLSGWNETFEKQSIDTWVRCMEVNLNSVFHISQALAPILKKNKNANIVNIGSIYGFLAPDKNLYKDTDINNPAAYSVSKSGIIYLTKWLASYLAPKIRVNCISPGGIFRNQDKLFVKKYIQSTPLKRMATEEDFIGVIKFLTSDASNYITGQNIIVDGGKSII